MYLYVTQLLLVWIRGSVCKTNVKHSVWTRGILEAIVACIKSYWEEFDGYDLTFAKMAELEASFIPALYQPSSLLPIARHRESLIYAVEEFPVSVVIGQTGSGKTTQLPQFLDQAGWCADGKIIGVTQVGEFVYLEHKQRSI